MLPNATTPPTIAVIPVRNTNMAGINADSFTALIRSKLSERANGKVVFLARDINGKAIEQLLDEKDLKKLDMVKTKKMKDLYGVDYFLSGELISEGMSTNSGPRVNATKRLNVMLIDADDGSVPAEKLVTLGCRANRAVEAAATADDKQKAALIAEGVHCRRLVAARVRQQARSLFKGTAKTKGKVARDKWRENEDVVHILFDKIAPQFKGRNGGYTRILLLGGTQGKWAGQRRGDAAKMAIIDFGEDASAAPAEAPAAEVAK